jgi:hypothetical protein
VTGGAIGGAGIGAGVMFAGAFAGFPPVGWATTMDTFAAFDQLPWVSRTR